MAVEITFHDHFPALLDGWDAAIEAAVVKVSADVLADSQRNIKRNGQIKTGNMLNSGQVEPAEDRFHRYVHYHAGYSAYQELGTRYMAGRPFLLPAVEHNRGAFKDALHAISRLAAP